MKRQFLEGGVGWFRPRKSLDDLSFRKPKSTAALSNKSLNPGDTKIRSSADLKAKAQSISIRPKKSSFLSKVFGQRARTTTTKQKGKIISATKVDELTDTLQDSVTTLKKNPLFKRAIDDIEAKKTQGFKSKAESKKLSDDTSAAVNDIKATAKSKADAEGIEAKKSLLSRMSDSAAAAKKKLSDSIDDMKAKFKSKFDKTSGEFPPKLNNKLELEDVSLKKKAHLEAEEANLRKQRLSEADALDAEVNSGRVRQPKTDGDPDTGSGVPEGYPKKVKGETPDDVAPNRTKEYKQQEVKNKETAKKHETKANKASDDADNINSRPDRPPRDSPDADAPNSRFKNDLELAKRNMKSHFDTSSDWRNSLRALLSSASNALMFILPIILPTLQKPPMPQIGPINVGPPFNPGSVFSPTVFPSLPNPQVVYRPYRVENVPPKLNVPKDIKIPNQNFELPTFKEGYLVFRLETQPDDNISFQITTDSDKLELEESLIVFPIDTWDTPVRVAYSTTLEKDLSGNLEYNQLDIRDRYNLLRSVAPGGIKEKIYADVSLDEYYPTQQEIDVVYNKLDKLLKNEEETYTQALANVQNKISRRRRYRGGVASIDTVEPTYDAESYKDLDYTSVLVEPTYDSDDYSSYTEEIEPTYDSDDYSTYVEEITPSISVEPSIEDDSWQTYESVIDPTFDDGWNPYEESVYGGDESTSNPVDESTINKIAESLDYDMLAKSIELNNLSDDYKATIQIQSIDSLNFEMFISIAVEDDSTWTLKPPNIRFDESTVVNNILFFSQSIFKELVNLHVATQVQSIQDDFERKISDYEAYETSAIDENVSYEAQQAYNEAYMRSMEREEDKIRAAEYISEKLREDQSGGTSVRLNKLKNRSRKRKIK